MKKILWAVIVIVAVAVIGTGLGWFVLRKSLFNPKAREKMDIERANNLCWDLNVAGNRYAQAGMFDSALACYREALRIGEKYALSERMAASYLDISHVYDYLNQPESTEFYLKKASALHRVTRKKSPKVVTILEEGIFRFQNLGDIDSGKVLLEKALAEARRNENFWSECVALCNLGRVHIVLDNYDSALSLFKAAAEVSNRCHDHSTEAGSYLNLAYINCKRHKLDEALDYLIKAMRVAHDAELIADEACALLNAGIIRMEKKQFKLARMHLERAQELYQKINDEEGVDECRFYRYLLQEIEASNRPFQSSDSTFEALRRKTGTM